MSKLRDILIERMVGDMTRILTPKNALKSPEELGSIVMPKVDAAAGEIKTMLLEIVAESRDQMLPVAYIEKKITEL